MIQRALDEDLGSLGDISSCMLFNQNDVSKALIMSKGTGVVCGLSVAGAVFSCVNPTLTIKQIMKDGQSVKPGQVVLEVEGQTLSILKAERVALNFLCHLSGVSTLTNSFVKICEGYKTKILDTRKTTPLFRHLEKYAVRMGGGSNHRMGLYDEVMIKDNHLVSFKGDLVLVLKQFRESFPNKVIVLEIAHLDQLKKYMDAPVSRFLLDNMSDDQIQACMRQINGQKPVEISGGITQERIKRLCDLGVDFISVGQITHSAPIMNFSLEFVQ